MEIIPVVDLKAGRVVRARLGRRDEYLPIETPLSPTSDPVDVARGLLSLHPFETLYVADLDAIECSGANDDSIGLLRAAFPELSLWVDNGVGDLAAAKRWLASGRGHLVMGSESQRDLRFLDSLADERRVVLSLDFRGDAFQGPPEILDDPRMWPERVIVMTLARVGSGAGPDIDRLTTIRGAAPDRGIYAAGGVRDLRDLENLARAGIAGALVSTSLHDGRLSGPQIIAARSF